jgi:hypothetical protein
MFSFLSKFPVTTLPPPTSMASLKRSRGDLSPCSDEALHSGTAKRFDVGDVIEIAKEASEVGENLMELPDPLKKHLGSKNYEIVRSNVLKLLEVISTLSVKFYTLIVENEKLIDSG